MRKRLAAYSLILVIAVGLILGVRLAVRNSELWLTFEFGPVQLIQASILLASLVLILRLLRRLGLGDSDSPATVAVAFLVFFLTWREIEIDNLFWQVHAFSWKYLLDPDLSPAVKVGLGAPSLTLAALVLVYLIPRAPATIRQTLARRQAPSAWLLAGGLGTLGVAQLWDKATSIAYRFGIDFFVSGRRDPLPEEILELVGELLVLFCVVEFRRECAARQAERSVPAALPVRRRFRPAPQRGLRRTVRRPADQVTTATQT